MAIEVLNTYVAHDVRHDLESAVWLLVCMVLRHTIQVMPNKHDEVEVEYPVGHKRRRAEGTPLLMAKFKRHVAPHFDEAHQKK